MTRIIRNITLIKVACLLSFAMVCVLSSCGSDEEDADVVQWRTEQVAYYQNIYAKAQSEIATATAQGKECKDWYIFTAYDKQNTGDSNDNIVVQVLNEKKHSENPDSNYAAIPYYLDKVRLFYRGYTGAASTNKLQLEDGTMVGYQFETSWNGPFITDLDYTTAADKLLYKPSEMSISSLTVGFATAVMHMHVGDKWRVYIPYQLGYGSSTSGTIKAYSTLVFDIYLVAIGRNGETMPNI